MDYIRSAVDSFVRREIDVDEFRQAFVGSYFYVRNDAAGDKEAQALASRLMVPVAEFSAGHRAETSLRLELAKAIRPFEQPNANVFLMIEHGAVKITPKASVSARPNTIEWGLNGRESTAFPSAAA